MIAEQDTATEDIAKRGDEALAKLEQHYIENACEISKIHAEITALRQDRDDCAKKLKQIKDNISTLEAQYNQAVQYTNLAHGTIRENEGIKTISSIKKQCDDEKKALKTLIHQKTEADKASNEREAELSSSLQNLQAEQECLQSDMDGTKMAREQAYADLGKQRYAAFLQAYASKQEQETTLRLQLITAQVEKNDVLVAGINALTTWPELQKIALELKSHEDPISRVLDASLHYAETYANEIQQLPLQWDIALPSLRRGYHLLDATMVPIEEILRGRQNISDLRARIDLINDLCDEYKAYLATKNK